MKYLLPTHFTSMKLYVFIINGMILHVNDFTIIKKNEFLNLIVTIVSSLFAFLSKRSTSRRGEFVDRSSAKYILILFYLMTDSQKDYTANTYLYIKLIVLVRPYNIVV